MKKIYKNHTFHGAVTEKCLGQLCCWLMEMCDNDI